MSLFSVEMCAGAGGQALGLEQAGFEHTALVEIERECCNTLIHNRPSWNVQCSDLSSFDGRPYRGADLLAGGLPCPPFSIAGKQLGEKDERNLFPAALRLVDEIRPKAVLIENVRGFLGASFAPYRLHIKEQLRKLGYTCEWKLLNASDFGVPQLRPRVAIVALRSDFSDCFQWPEPPKTVPATVGQVLGDLMGANGWRGTDSWKEQASSIAPTIVGGSKKHGGPDLGPTRARAAWAAMGVNGISLAEEAPDVNFSGIPRLTVRMVARLQGFPDDWLFTGRKTAAYRQVGNAFPPPVAKSLASQLMIALTSRRRMLVA
jgi:DNA (cytosine-5)-methyltransferase 1